MGCISEKEFELCKEHIKMRITRIQGLINCLIMVSLNGKQLLYLKDRERYTKWLLSMVEHGNINTCTCPKLLSKLKKLEEELKQRFCMLQKYGCFNFLPLKVKVKTRGVRYA